MNPRDQDADYLIITVAVVGAERVDEPVDAEGRRLAADRVAVVGAERVDEPTNVFASACGNEVDRSQ